MSLMKLSSAVESFARAARCAPRASTKGAMGGHARDVHSARYAARSREVLDSAGGKACDVSRARVDGDACGIVVEVLWYRFCEV